MLKRLAYLRNIQLMCSTCYFRSSVEDPVTDIASRPQSKQPVTIGYMHVDVATVGSLRQSVVCTAHPAATDGRALRRCGEILR